MRATTELPAPLAAMHCLQTLAGAPQGDAGGKARAVTAAARGGWPGRAGMFVTGAVLFALIHCQAPLYYCNQNHRFLHGLADAGVGCLSADWLVSTRDPTPLFTRLVALTVRWLHPWAFHVYYAVLLGLYFVAVLGIRGCLCDTRNRQRLLLFSAIFLLAHSNGLRWCADCWLGHDYAWYLQCGVAGQYILGAVFQPSTFGVLLVVALALFVRGQQLATAMLTALAATVHQTYLLPAALLTLGFLVALALERRWTQALTLGGVTLLLVLPALIHAATVFAPTTPELFARARQILVEARIPHHCLPQRWFDRIASCQLAWIVLGTALAWRTRLFPVLATAFLLGSLLSLIQVATGSYALALIFPWRISAVLVPVATVVVLARFMALPWRFLESPAAGFVAVCLMLSLAGAGVAITFARTAYHTNDEELPVLAFAHAHATPDTLYLLPMRQRTPYDFNRFRLLTGTPIYVDFKSIPYKDTEVITWYERVCDARQLDERIRAGKLSDLRAELRQRKITHVVVPAGTSIGGAGLHAVHMDAAYVVVALE